MLLKLTRAHITHSHTHTHNIAFVRGQAEDHAFEIYADPGFRSALSTEAPAQKVSKRVKPNEKCPW